MELKTADENKRPRPLLMMPLRRCGSHALRLRMNFNPEFHSPYPLHIVDFMPLVPLYGDLEDDRAYFRLVVDVVGLQAVSMVKWPDMVYDPVEIFEQLRHEPRSVHRIVWELLLRAGERTGAKIVMDKSLDSVHYADELMRLFPDMLFLNVVRDPRGQVASMNRAIIHDFDSTLNARTWVQAHDAARTLLERYPERVLTIRYEDFLADQEETLRTVCGFIGIEFLPEMLDVAHSPEARKISRLSALWASNCFAPIPANADKFKQQLSLDDIRVIETLTRDYMRTYGYELMTAADAVIADASFEVARARSDRARQAAWSELEQANFRDYVLRKARADYLAQVRARLEQSAAGNGGPGGDRPYKLDMLDVAFEVTD
jgi:hypothetical protein